MHGRRLGYLALERGYVANVRDAEHLSSFKRKRQVSKGKSGSNGMGATWIASADNRARR